MNFSFSIYLERIVFIFQNELEDNFFFAYEERCNRIENAHGDLRAHT